MSFYKDGYTDLVGRFDYASISTSNLKNVKSIAMFIMSDELGNFFIFYFFVTCVKGAIIKETVPPS